jgi:uncharacterized XkdX family phage protein
MHSAKFARVKNYYNAGFWSKKMVSDAVRKGWITAEDYHEIINEMYGV